MDAAFGKIIDTIAGQGTGYLLFALAVCAIGWLVLQSRSDNREYVKKLEDIQRERLEEAKADVSALLASANSTSTSNTALGIALSANTAALAKLTEAFADVLKDNEHGREIWQLQLASLKEGQGTIATAIMNLKGHGK